MKKHILMLVLLCSFLMFGCSEKSKDVTHTTTKENKDAKENITVVENTANKNTAEQVEESTELSSPKSDFDSYFKLINKSLEELESLYGQTDLKYAMYGGDLYYYDKLKIGFGVDGDTITSVLIYKGELDNGIKINMPLEEALETLQLSQSDVGEDGEGGEVVFSEYNSYDSYMRFYDAILKEILIKKD